MDDKQLIEEVQKHPELYDPKRRDYRDIDKRELAWSEIAEVMGYSLPEVQTRWKVLRDRYVREKKAAERGGHTTQKEPWHLMNLLSFLHKVVTHRKCKSTNRNLSLTKVSNAQSDVPMDPQPADLLDVCLLDVDLNSPGDSVVTGVLSESSDSNYQLTKGKRKRHSPDLNSSNEIGWQALGINGDIIPKQYDENDLFCMSLSHSLKRLSPQKRASAKIKIMQLLYSFEFGDEL